MAQNDKNDMQYETAPHSTGRYKIVRYVITPYSLVYDMLYFYWAFIYDIAQRDTVIRKIIVRCNMVHYDMSPYGSVYDIML